MREEVKGLQACWLGEVSCVCMSRKGEIGVCSIRKGQVGDKVVETSVMGCSDRTNLFEYCFCSFWGHRCIDNEGEPMLPL